MAAKAHSTRWTILACLGGLVVLIALTIWAMALFSKHQFETYRADLEARGEIFNARQLAPPPARTAGNGADTLITACDDVITLVKKNNFKQYELGQLQTVPGEAEILHRRQATRQQKADVPWEKFESEVTPLRPLLARVRETSQAEVLEIQPDYTQGLSMRLPYLTGMIGASQHLGRETLLFLREKNYGDAVANVQAMLRMSATMAKQYSLISQLVSLSIIQIASVSTWEILNSEAPREEIEKISAAWAPIRPSAKFAASLRMERAWGCEFFASPVSALWSTSPLGGPFLGPGGATPGSLEDLFRQGVWQTWAALYRYSDEKKFLVDYQGLLDRDEKSGWKTSFPQAKAIEDSLTATPFSRLLSRLLLSTIPGTVKRFATVDALRELTVTAIAIRLYQLDHEEKLPDSLESLIPTYLSAVPLDPIDLQPLRYQNKGAKFLLYSIGADGVDDSGNASEPKGKHARQLIDRMDIVWPVPAP